MNQINQINKMNQIDQAYSRRLPVR